MADLAHALGARNGNGPDARGHLAPFEEFGGFDKVGDPGIGAGAEKGDLNFLTGKFLPRFELHELEGFPGGGTVRFRQILRRGDGLIDKDALSGVDAPSDRGADLRGLKDLHVVVGGIRIRSDLFPFPNSRVPILALGAVGATLEILESLLVGIHVSDPGTAFDGHIANGHPLFQGKAFDCRAGIFVGKAGASIHPEGSDDVEDDVFGIDARAKFAANLDLPDLEGGKGHGLRGQHIADLTGANPESHGTEGPVGGGVGVSAGDGCARLGDSLFGTDDMDNALFSRGDVEESDSKIGAIFAEFLDHGVGQGVLEGLDPLVSRDDMVDRGEGALGECHFQAEVPEHSKRLRAGHLMDQVGPDEELGGAVGKFFHGMPVPDFLEKRFTHKYLKISEIGVLRKPCAGSRRSRR